jgi:hypothetical protein
MKNRTWTFVFLNVYGVAMTETWENKSLAVSRRLGVETFVFLDAVVCEVLVMQENKSR